MQKEVLHGRYTLCDTYGAICEGDAGLNAAQESMAENSIVFAMANPIPEIYTDGAKDTGARIVGSGRSDFPNQVNNVFVFPGIFGERLIAAHRISAKA